MKGIAHFTTGVTVASFFPAAIAAAQEGNPLYFMLGGVFGLLPDTLDFKCYRFFYKHDVYIKPDPQDPDPQAIADQLAAAFARAHTENREIRIKLNTLRVGGDQWQQYTVQIDNDAQEIRVRFGPIVNTGQVPVPDSDRADAPTGRAAIPYRFFYNYESLTTVDIFDGPSFAVQAPRNGVALVEFLPWHRGWSHSLLTGCFFGLLAGSIWGLPAGGVAALAFCAHVMEDQLGHMGSALFWPLRRQRYQGIGQMHATDTAPNFLTVWLCVLLMFWNMYRVTLDPVYLFTLPELLFYAGFLPIGLFWMIHKAVTRRQPMESAVPESSDEWIDPMGSS